MVSLSFLSFQMNFRMFLKNSRLKRIELNINITLESIDITIICSGHILLVLITKVESDTCGNHRNILWPNWCCFKTLVTHAVKHYTLSIKVPPGLSSRGPSFHVLTLGSSSATNSLREWMGLWSKKTPQVIRSFPELMKRRTHCTSSLTNFIQPNTSSYKAYLLIYLFKYFREQSERGSYGIWYNREQADSSYTWCSFY